VFLGAGRFLPQRPGLPTNASENHGDFVICRPLRLGQPRAEDFFAPFFCGANEFLSELILQVKSLCRWS
jgi:hypothetical protein